MLFSGCESLSFYHQLASGQTQILLNRQNIDQLILDPSTDEELREQLIKIESMRQYAESHLGLVAKGSFSSYVDLKREYVLWNVFASEPYSVEPVNRCYPIVGCVAYRGYFSRQVAINHAQKLVQQEELETYVGGVPAYSTLGWFEDPVLNTFVLELCGEVHCSYTFVLEPRGEVHFSYTFRATFVHFSYKVLFLGIKIPYGRHGGDYPFVYFLKK